MSFSFVGGDSFSFFKGIVLCWNSSLRFALTEDVIRRLQLVSVHYSPSSASSGASFSESPSGRSPSASVQQRVSPVVPTSPSGQPMSPILRSLTRFDFRVVQFSLYGLVSIVCSAPSWCRECMCVRIYVFGCVFLVHTIIESVCVCMHLCV